MPRLPALRRLAGDPRDDRTDRDLLRGYAGGDEGAFDALVRRHGPLVLGACRRALPDPHAADDAFQATFLALAEQARSPGWGESVAGWLHTVAGRVAAKARVAAARRAARERAAARDRPPVVRPPAVDDLAAVVDEELRALPNALRDPLVLCYLEGLTAERAARRLGSSPRTVERRLAHGREVLAGRLARRGVAPGAALLAAACGPAAVAGRLADAAVALAADPAAAAPGVAALAAAAAPARAGARLAVAVMAAGLAVTTAGVALRPDAGPPLGQAPPAPAERPGDPLPPGAVARLGGRLPQPGRVSDVGFSPDGAALLVSALGADGLHLWDPATGRQLRRLPGFAPTGPGGNGFAADAGLTVVAGPAEGGAVRLWDAATGAVRQEFAGHPGGTWAVALSAGGRTLVTVGQDRTVRRWDVATGQETARHPIDVALDGGAGTLGYSPVVLSPDGRTAAVLREVVPTPPGAPRLPDNWRQLVDTATGRTAAAVRRPGHRADWAAFSPDGRLLATCGNAEPVARLWDPATGAELCQLPGAGSPVGPVAFSPDGRAVATAFGREVQLWDPATGRQTGAVPTGLKAHSYLAVGPGGRTVATGYVFGPLQVWDAVRGQELHGGGHADRVTALHFGADGTLASADADGGVRWWRAEAGEELAAFAPAAGREWLPAFAPDGRTFVTADGPRLTVRAARTGAVVHRLADAPAAVIAVGFTGDGRTVAAADQSGGIGLWDVATGDRRAAVPAPGGPVVVSPDGTTLASLGRADDGGPAVRLSDAWTSRPRHTAPAPAAAGGLAFAPDGRTLAVAAGPAVHLLDAATLRETTALRPAGGEAVVAAVAFAPGVVAVGGADGVVRLFDPATGRERRALAGHRTGVTALAFAPDGRRLASGGEDGTAFVWAVRP